MQRPKEHWFFSQSMTFIPMNHQIILVCLALINTRPSAPLQSTSDDCMFFFFWNAPFTLRYLRRGFLILEGYVVAMAFNIILN